jgi:hypothetical protein
MTVRKKALIITYYWPPSGGPGVQRWLKFVKYLGHFNIDPIVYIPENPSYPLLDESLLKDIPSHVKIIKQPIKEPYRFSTIFSKNKTETMRKGIISDTKHQGIFERLLIYIRGNFFIPDARIGWVKPSTKFLLNYLQNEPIDAIITTGPPHSIHLIGLHIKESLGLRWIADFRDPWTTIGYHKQLKLSKKAKLKHKDLEKQVLNSADQIIVTSLTTKKEFEIITKTPIEVITNGYDVTTARKETLDDKFTMSHIGSLLSKRNPEVLWRVLSDLVSENKAFSEDLQLNFIGLLSDDVLNSIEKYNLSNHISKVGYISHNEAIKYQKKSQLLLLIEIDSDDTKCIIPGKLFEYMVSNRPIIALGPKNSDVETIIKETNTGTYFYYDDYNSLKTTILSHYSDYKKAILESHPMGLMKYSRKSLTESLSKLI